MLPNEISAHPHSCPVDDFQEGNDAEPKEKAKKSSKGGDKLNRSHGNASLQLYHKKLMRLYVKEISFTYHSFLSKENVESGNILIPGIISILSNLGENWVKKGSILVFHLRRQFDQRIKVFISLRACDVLNVVRETRLARLMINLFNLKQLHDGFHSKINLIEPKFW